MFILKKKKISKQQPKLTPKGTTEQTEPKMYRWEKIINVRVKWNRNRKKKSVKPRAFFKKINKSDKSLAKLRKIETANN